MKELLITGFDPFGGLSRNPSWEAVQQLPEQIGGYHLNKRLLPTVFGLASEEAYAAALECGAQVILCVGVAEGRDTVTVERIAVNLRDAIRKDNAGLQPADEPCVAGGPAACFSTLPVKAMARACGGRVSLSAGSFVCNDTLYRLLHRFQGSDVGVGFIHVPQIPELTEGPSMKLEDTVGALVAAIRALEN